jgi:ParB-like chromosome segregation protein Spo0J
MMVPIDNIRIGNRLRQVRPEHVAHLAESIATLGLQQPISVRAKSFTKADGVNFEPGYMLVAGLHRLEACKRLGLVEIEANVITLGEAESQLWEIDENLCRADLTELEQGEHLIKRKEIYEWWRPETKAGGDRRSEDFKRQNLPLEAFATDTAVKTGIADRTIRQSIRRATKIDPKVRDRIRDNPEIADSGVELDALASMQPEQQTKAVALVEAGSATGIRDAGRLMRPTKEAQIRALRERDASPAGSLQSRFGIADELEQVLRMLRGDRSRIGQIPLAKRVALARGCLKLLDVALDDLKPIGGAP